MEQNEVDLTLMANELSDAADHLREIVKAKAIQEDNTAVFAVGHIDGHKELFGLVVGDGPDIIQAISETVIESNEILAIIMAAFIDVIERKKINCSDIFYPMLDDISTRNKGFKFILSTINTNSNNKVPTFDFNGDINYMMLLLKNSITDWFKEKGYKFKYELSEL